MASLAEQIQSHIKRSIAEGYQEIKFGAGPVQLTYYADEGRGIIDVVADVEKNPYKLKEHFDKVRASLPEGEWELNPDTPQKQRIYERWFRKDPSIRPSGDTNMKGIGREGFVLTKHKDWRKQNIPRSNLTKVEGGRDMYDISNRNELTMSGNKTTKPKNWEEYITNRSELTTSGGKIRNVGQRGVYWPDHIPKNVREAYGRRRALLNNAEGQLKRLKKGTTAYRNKLREIKALVETDPTAYKSHNVWKTANQTDWQSHHIRGLDDYYDAMKGMDDLDLMDFHEEAAKRGHYFGNHPRNKQDLHRSLHVGQARRFAAGVESVHGMTAYTRLPDADALTDYVYNPTKVIGSGDTFDLSGSKRYDIPKDWDLMGQEELRTKAFWFADQDKINADKISKVGASPIQIKGKLPPAIRDNIISQMPEGMMSPDLKDSLAANDWATAKRLGSSEVKQYKAVNIGQRLENLRQHKRLIDQAPLNESKLLNFTRGADGVGRSGIAAKASAISPAIIGTQLVQSALRKDPVATTIRGAELLTDVTRMEGASLAIGLVGDAWDRVTGAPITGSDSLPSRRKLKITAGSL